MEKVGKNKGLSIAVEKTRQKTSKKQSKEKEKKQAETRDM